MNSCYSRPLNYGHGSQTTSGLYNSSRPQTGHVQKHRTVRYSVDIKVVVHGNTRASGLVAPLLCTAYFGKLAILFGRSVPCHSKHRPSPFVLVSQLELEEYISD